MGKYLRHVMSDSEEMRIKMYLAFGGFHYRTIAARVYGEGKPGYEPDAAEISRVGRVAKDWNLSSRDWRNGKTDAAAALLNKLGRVRRDSRPTLKVVA